METIFFVLFRSSNSYHDRTEYFNKEKTFEEFMKWLSGKRDALEKEVGPVVVDKFDIKYRD